MPKPRKPPPGRRPSRRFTNLLVRLFVLVLAILLLAGTSLAWLILAPLELRESPLEFHIEPRSSLRSAAQQINAAGVDLSPWLLVALGRASGVAASIKAGSYELVDEVNAWDLLQKITRGDVTQSEVRFIEGWTWRQMRARLDAHPDLRHDTSGLDDATILARIGLRGTAAEGLFFPDTYLFARRSSDVDILARAARTMDRHLQQAWAERAANLPYRNPYEALIMASIVEKETGRDAERTLIAAVFVNRLRLGMPLQTDPTVIYGLGERFDGNLRKRDLTTDTPYNTYTRPGLPPGPIALPGLNSLRAALHPANSDALYFVARGDGSSQFSRTLDEHNRAVARYQKGGKP